MSEPQIQYTKTSDGVTIAYYAVGEGAPILVFAPLGPSHLRLERNFPDLALWYDHISESRTLIRYDPRNLGLSDRRVADISDEAFSADIDAVCVALDIDGLDIVGAGPGAFGAVRLAAARPEFVQKLLLIAPILRGRDYWPGEQGAAVLKLAETDWDLFVQTASHARFGWSSEEAHAFAEIWRENELQEDFLRQIPRYLSPDLRESLGHVVAETLVMYPTMARFARQHERAAREVASTVKGSKVFDWADGSYYYMSNPAAIHAIDDFLGIPRMSFAIAESPAPSGLATILFTDVEGSTALTDRLGDAAARELLREHERITRSALASYGGSEVKALGDGFMASFRSATGALDCAIALQREFWERGVASEHKDELRIRIGINAGEPVAEDGDLFGTSVNLAARIAAQASGGDIVVSDVVRQLVAGKGYLFNDRGETTLRGFEDSVKLYDVKWRE